MSRVGQTMLVRFRGRAVPVECIRDFSDRVYFQSLDLEHSGYVASDTWDGMRAGQRKARRDEGEEFPPENG